MMLIPQKPLVWLFVITVVVISIVLSTHYELELANVMFEFAFILQKALTDVVGLVGIWTIIILGFGGLLLAFCRFQNRISRMFIGFLYILSLILTVFIYRVQFEGRLDSVYRSPDAEYEFRVYALPNWSMSPGSGSDWPGYLRLYNKDGTFLAFQYFPMSTVLMLPVWKRDEVQVGTLGYWTLPDGKKL